MSAFMNLSRICWFAISCWLAWVIAASWDRPLIRFGMTLVVFGCGFCAAVFLIAGRSRPRSRTGAFLQNRRSCIALSAATSLLLTITASLLFWPIPRWHDEYSYLLAADTYSSGRITNETHPYWEHFETYHVIQQPTYISKYPPAQGLSLALGMILTGVPLVGVWIANGLVAASVSWALFQWFPRRIATLTSLLIALHPVVLIDWGQSYMGGQMAAIGGSLLFGVYRKLRTQWTVGSSLTMGLGVVILANSRPYEGLLTSIPVALALLGDLENCIRKGGTAIAFRRLIIPTLAVLSAGTAMMLYYNFRTTGSSVEMPYSVYTRNHHGDRVFLWQDDPPEPSRSLQLTEGPWGDLTEPSEYFYMKMQHAKNNLRAYLGYTALSPVYLMGLAGCPFLLCRRKYRLVAVCLGVALIGQYVSITSNPHYIAPNFVLMAITLGASILHLSRIPMIKRRSWDTFAGFLLFTQCTMAVVSTGLYGWHHNHRPPRWEDHRHRIARQLDSKPGQHLVFINYTSAHSIHDEWVYNEGDIDASRIVWARSLGERDRRLRDYFPGRSHWSIDADDKKPRLRPL